MSSKKRKTRRILIVLLMLFGIGAIYTWATWQFFTKQVLGGNDFVAHYTAWEAFIKSGVSPYSDAAALHSQQVIYGRPALPGEDQNRLTYPFYSGLIHAPFVLFGDHTLARAFYMVLLQIALFVGVIWTTKLVRWELPLWLLAVILAWSLLYYPQARGVILGQFAIFGFFSMVSALYLLKQERDFLAGALLVLSTVKPTLVFLVIPFLLIWAVVRRRWVFVVGFLGIFAVVNLGSLLISPTWISEWLYRMGRYSGYTVGQSPVWLLTHVLVPGLGELGEWVISALLLVGIILAWWRALRPGGQIEFYWALSITLVVSNLIVTRSATTNYVMMLLPVLWVFAALDRTAGWGRSVLLVTMLVSFVGLWWLHFATVVGNQEQAILFVPSPLILGLVLIFGHNWLLSDARKAGVGM